MVFSIRSFLGFSLVVGFLNLPVSLAENLKWSCKVPRCKNCSLTVDLGKDEVEYTSDLTTYSLKQTSKSEEFRSYLVEPNAQLATSGYRALFLRDQKRIALYEVDAAKKEKILFTGAACKRGR